MQSILSGLQRLQAKLPDKLGHSPDVLDAVAQLDSQVWELVDWLESEEME